MIPILFVVGLIAAVAAVGAVRRMKAGRQQSQRKEVLRELAPIISGTLSEDLTLVGTYRGHAVEAVLTTTDPTPRGTSRYTVEVVRLRLGDVAGQHPWKYHAALRLIGGPTFTFVGESGVALMAFQRFSGGVAPDPELDNRLRTAGIIEALERVGPPSKTSLPHVSFTPDLKAAWIGQLRGAGIAIPASKLEHTAEGVEGLRIQVERVDDRDPTPERFRQLLEAAVGIAKVNAKANVRSGE